MLADNQRLLAMRCAGRPDIVTFNAACPSIRPSDPMNALTDNWLAPALMLFSFKKEVNGRNRAIQSEGHAFRRGHPVNADDRVAYRVKCCKRCLFASHVQNPFRCIRIQLSFEIDCCKVALRNEGGFVHAGRT